MAEEDYIKAPTSRLDANTVASSRAMDASRRATSDQRQGMAVERMLQRKWKRAVRKDDYGAMAAIGNEMKDMGLSRIGKGGIQSSEQNDLEAFRRAETARRTGNRAAKEMDAILGPDGEEPAKAGEAPPKEDAGAAIERDVANERSSEGAGYGRPAGTPSDPSSRLLAENNPAPSSTLAGKPKWQPDSRKQFIADLEKSDSFKRGDSEAIERAAKRGSKYGISKEQLELYANNEKASPSMGRALLEKKQKGGPDQKALEREESIKKRLWDPVKPGEETALEGATRVRNSGIKLDSIKEDIFDRELAIVDSEAKTRRLRGRDDMQPSPDPDFSESRALLEKKKEDKELAAQTKKAEMLEGLKAQGEADKWNVDPNKFLFDEAGVERIGVRDDPRYAALKLKKDAFEEAWWKEGKILPFGANKDAPAKQNALAKKLMIEKSIQQGVDISGFTKQDPEWHAQYESARMDDQKLKSAMASQQENQAQFNDMASAF